jgi:hypothetical protein
VSAATIRITNLDGTPAFHAVQVDAENWHWSSPSVVGVMMAYRQSLITSALTAIAGGGVSLVIEEPDSRGHRWYLDALHGAWDEDGEYRTAAQLLCLHIPSRAVGRAEK